MTPLLAGFAVTAFVALATRGLWCRFKTQEENVGDFDELIKRLGLATLDGRKYVRRLGGGGQGTVCLYERGDEQVACKLLIAPHSEEDVRRLTDEAGALAACQLFAKPEGATRSSLVTALTQVEKVVGLPVYYFFMEVAGGATLSNQMVSTKPPWKWRRATEIVWRTACALSPASAAGRVHRDLHPGNIFIDDERFTYDQREGTGDPGVTIVDFGVQRDTWEDIFPSATTAGTFRPVGSVSYLSPEGLETPSSVTPVSDVWALGVMLHELVTGIRPFNAPSLIELVKQTKQGLQGDLPKAQGATPSEERIVHKLLRGMLNPDPSVRLRIVDLTRIASDALYYDLAASYPGSIEDYYRARGNIVFCGRCRQLSVPVGARCGGCGASDADGLSHWSLGR